MIGRAAHGRLPAALCVGWKCRCCGLLQLALQQMLCHVKECHVGRHGSPRPEQEALLQTTERVFRPRRLLQAQEAVVSWFGIDPTGCAAMKHAADVLERHRQGVSCGEVRRMVGFLRTLLSYASFPEGARVRGREGVLLVPSCISCFYVFLGAARWRRQPSLWGALISVLLTGHWRGCNLLQFGPCHDVSHRMPYHRRVDFEKVCSIVNGAAENVETSIGILKRSFHEAVLYSHGDHVPLKVRNYSTLLFWLPRILEETDLSDASQFWQGAEECMSIVLAWVGNQVDVFDWPDAQHVLRQYKALMVMWRQLSRRRDIASKAWAVCKPSHDAGCCAESAFCWKYRWQVAHTDNRFCPAGLEAAFTLYHFTGMLGLSEALAESICSTLAFYSAKHKNRLALDRIVEKTILFRGGAMGPTICSFCVAGQNIIRVCRRTDLLSCSRIGTSGLSCTHWGRARR